MSELLCVCVCVCVWIVWLLIKSWITFAPTMFFIFAFWKGLIIKMGHHLNKLSDIQKTITEEIHQWKLRQQKAMSGWPDPESLDTLQQL